MLVAEGAVDVMIDPFLALWYMAALDLIVREAGGRCISLDGVDGLFGSNVISSNNALDGALIKHDEHHCYSQNHFVFGSHVRNLVGSQKHALTN
jgi:3'-phosphoadenosine 5'-phosphosulfate (PAPS) 3'-phosphatase